MKVVINTCYGGFGLSEEALQLLAKKGVPITLIYNDGKTVNAKGIEDCPLFIRYYEEEVGWWIFKETRTYYQLSLDGEVARKMEFRTSKLLLEVIEELGDKANGYFAELKIVEVPDSEIKQVHIDNYDGVETVIQNHKEWS